MALGRPPENVRQPFLSHQKSRTTSSEKRLGIAPRAGQAHDVQSMRDGPLDDRRARHGFTQPAQNRDRPRSSGRH
jgi:hypothetical protein